MTSPTGAPELQPCRQCGTMTVHAGPYCCSACRLLADAGLGERLRETAVGDPWRPWDRREILDTYDFSTDPGLRRFRFYVEGLQCSSCVHLLEKLPDYDDDIRSARVRFGESELLVETRPTASLARLGTLIAELGYRAHPLRPDESTESRNRRDDRDLIKRIAVAGFSAGNTMILTIPLYSGLEGPARTAFAIGSLVLFLPTLLYAAVPFYRGAWAGLRSRSLNVDTPLTVAIWAGFLASTWNLWRGSDLIYYDSTAGFLFLILVSRWFLRRVQRHAHRDAHGTRGLFPDFVRCHDGFEFIERPVDRLQPGDLIEIDPGQILPVDGELQDETAAFDTSLVSGESIPRVYQKGQLLSAGLKSLERPTRIRTRTKASDSGLATALARIERDALAKSHRLDIFDRAARRLLTGVAIAAVLLWATAPLFGLSLDEGFQRGLALLIVACPCALAFGGPLASAIALKEGRRRGLLVKSADVLDRVLSARTFVFDKTGTLTEGHLRLAEQQPPALPDWMYDLILSLELRSSHPVAFAFRETWRHRPFRSLALRDVHESPGRVTGLYEGRLYALAASPSDERLGVELQADGRRVARFLFEDRVRAEAPDLIRRLARHGEVHILSGDEDVRARAAALAVGLPVERARGGCSPTEKVEFVQNHHDVLMIGDGLNDAGALAAASVGIAMNGAVEASLEGADVYLLRPGLGPVLELLDLAMWARTTVRRNLAFALAYNLGAGLAAALGLIGPLAAAVLMPISSLLILASTALSRPGGSR